MIEQLRLEILRETVKLVNASPKEWGTADVVKLAKALTDFVLGDNQ